MAIVLVRTLIIYVCIVFSLRFMGKRQLGELAPHELVVTILISSVATIPLQNNSTPLSTSLIPIAMLISLEIIQSVISMKSLKFRYIMQGRPIFIIRDGKLQQKAFKKLRLSLDDVIDALRQKDIFDISQVQNAIIETNGALSVQKKVEFETVNNNTLNIKQEKNQIPITIVMDGKKIDEYFKYEIISEKEIEIILKSQELNLNEIMYMSIDNNGKIVTIRKEK